MIFAFYMNPSTPITPTTLPKPSGKLIETMSFMKKCARNNCVKIKLYSSIICVLAILPIFADLSMAIHNNDFALVVAT